MTDRAVWRHTAIAVAAAAFFGLIALGAAFAHAPHATSQDADRAAISMAVGLAVGVVLAASGSAPLRTKLAGVGAVLLAMLLFGLPVFVLLN